MDIALNIKNKIEDFAGHMIESNALFLNAKSGSFTKETMSKYLKNIHYLVQQTVPNLQLALKLSKEKNKDEKLVHFFREKIDEEMGHDKWAEEDLKNFPESDHFISSEMKELLEYIKDRIEKDPTNYLPYIMLTEYFTVLTAEEWIKNLENNCHISREHLSVIDKHQELDKEHIKDDINIMNELFHGISFDEAEKELMETLKGSMKHFSLFCHNICQ